MKRCRKCDKTFDDSHKRCRECDGLLDPVVTIHKDELSLANVDQIFEKLFPEPFLPDDDFYGDWDGTNERLLKMMLEICAWLKISTVGLGVSYQTNLNTPGVYEYKANGDSSFILIDEQYNDSPFEAAAILAHECMHHYLRKNGLALADYGRNELKTDLATVCSGLGILIINGMVYPGQWHFAIMKLMPSFFQIDKKKRGFGYYEPKLYCQIFSRYLDLRDIDAGTVAGYINPYAGIFLPPEIDGKASCVKTGIVSDLEKKIVRNTVLLVISVLVAGCLLGAIYTGIGKELDRRNKITQDGFDTRKKEIDRLDGKIKRSDAELSELSKEMEYYEAAGDTEKYRMMKMRYKTLSDETRGDYERYMLLIKVYNERVAKTRGFSGRHR